MAHHGAEHHHKAAEHHESGDHEKGGHHLISPLIGVVFPSFLSVMSGAAKCVRALARTRQLSHDRTEPRP
jgi:hypothetical protein